MSDYHMFQCDRCGHTQKALILPKAWAHIVVQIEVARDSRTQREFDLCTSCYSSLDSMIRKPELEFIDTSIYERTLKDKAHV